MVGYRAYLNIGIRVLTVLLARNFTNLVEYIAYRIDLKHIINILHNAGKTLKTHSGVDVFVLKLGICAVSHIIELRENIVPYFHIAVAIAPRLAVGAAAAVFFAAVKVYFAARSAGACAVLPKVILFAEPYNVAFGYAYFITPYSVSLVILLINRGPQ